jgi:mannose-6-phosphate isomerase-like protein (cupin superfamily)
VQYFNNRNRNYGHSQLGQTDFGPRPFVTNMNEAARRNDFFRRALWTGEHLQLTLMSIGVNDIVGLEVHEEVDQFFYIVEGQGMTLMGDTRDCLNFRQNISCGSGIFVPAGIWHNVVNTGRIPLKLFTIYAPPEHPHGTIHRTKADAERHSY